jgi:excisionase family DNA binding protein
MSVLMRLGNSLNDAADRIGVSRDGLHDLIRKGELEAKKIGRRTIIAEEELQRFMASLPALKLRQ